MSSAVVLIVLLSQKILFLSLKNNVYKFINRPKTWNEAEAACNTFGAGHHLVSIQVKRGAIMRGLTQKRWQGFPTDKTSLLKCGCLYRQWCGSIFWFFARGAIFLKVFILMFKCLAKCHEVLIGFIVNNDQKTQWWHLAKSCNILALK